MPTERLTAFLAALDDGDGEAFCSPPGLGGGWRRKHVRIGLERNVLCVHRSGQILAFSAYTSKHGACQACTSRRGAICDHCACAHCQFDRLTSEYGGARVTPEQVARLRVRMRQFQFGSPVAAAVPGLDDEI